MTCFASATVDYTLYLYIDTETGCSIFTASAFSSQLPGDSPLGDGQSATLHASPVVPVRVRKVLRTTKVEARSLMSSLYPW